MINIEEANTYFSNRLSSGDWDNADNAEKQAALSEAIRVVNSLNYLGSPATSDNQFPRAGDTSVPPNIKYALCEIALELIKGFDLELEIEALRLTGQDFGGLKANYSTQIPQYLTAGVPSYKAWMYLFPYLRGVETFNLARG